MQDAPPRTVLLFGPPSVHLLRWRTLVERIGFVTQLVSYDEPHPDAIAHIPALPSGCVARLVALAYASLRLRRVLRRTSPALVQAHWLTGPGWIAALAGAHPLVVTAWGSDALRWTPASRLARLLARLVGRRASAVTYDADAVAKALEAAGVPRERLARVVIGADANVFRPLEKRRELLDRLGAPADLPVVLSARGLDPVYRQDVVVEAYAELVRTRPATLLLRVGADDDARLAELVAQARRSGCAEGVVPYRGVPPDKLPELLASVDAAISVPESDGTSVLLLECLLCETPVVVSDLPANREWIDPGSDRLVPVGDSAALAATLVRMLADPERARHDTAAAAARAREHGSTERQQAEIVSLYARVAPNPG